MLVDSVDLRVLPDLFAAAADRGDPVVLELRDEPPAYVYDLMRTLGVPVVVRPVMSALVNVDVRVAEGADGSIVVLGAYCSKCRAESSPNREGRCSFCGTVIVDEDSLSAKEMRAQLAGAGPAVNGVKADAARASAGKRVLPDRPCRTDGCPHRANRRYDRGPYSGLCEEVCIPARRAGISAVNKQAWTRRRAGAALSEREPKGREQLTSAPASSHPGASTPAGAVEGGSPRPLVGEPGSRSENAGIEIGSEIFDRLAGTVDLDVLRAEAERLNELALTASIKRDAIERLVQALEELAG